MSLHIRPATIDDAIALLVREGWVQRQYFDTCGTLATLHLRAGSP